MTGWDFETYEDRHGCYFFGKVLGGLLGGGGSKTSVSNETSTTVNVDVQPQIGVSVDNESVAQAIREIEKSNRALVTKISEGDEVVAEAIGQGLSNQAEGLKLLAGNMTETQQGLVVVAGLGVLFFIFSGKRHG